VNLHVLLMYKVTIFGVEMELQMGMGTIGEYFQRFSI
jgi:hypothetical protein